MVRLIIYFGLVATVATGLAWFADRPGNLTVEWLGSEVRTSVFVATLILLVVFVAIVLAAWLGILTLTAPRRIARRLKARRVRIGNEAVRRGIFAAGAGDRLGALRAGAIAKKNVPDEPLALLLEAQSAQLNEDPIASRQAFERMLDKPEMAELGLRGLFMEAKKAGQEEAAKQFAEQALTANAALAWSSAALFEIQCKDEDWRAALKTLGIAKQNRHLPKAEADRRRALLLTALAAELEDTQQSKALAYAIEANSLIPSLIPAAVIAGRILAAQGNVNRATKIVGQAWRLAPHPDLALIYGHARTGDSPRDRLQRVKLLVKACPPSVEGDIAVAVAAIEAKDWAAARAALEPHLAHSPQARICRLMARVEAGQNRDAGRAREWLAKAARAAPDPTWVAADGSVSSEWHPRSPLSGALGTFEWKAIQTEAFNADPVEAMPEMAALDAQKVEPQAVASIIEATANNESHQPAFTVTVKSADTTVKDPMPEKAVEIIGPAKAVASLGPDLDKDFAPTKSVAVAKDFAQKDDALAAKDVAVTDVEIQKNFFPKTEFFDPSKTPAISDKAQKPVTPPVSDIRGPGASVYDLSPAVTAAVAMELLERSKPEVRKPKIFIPDRPPDDPGPRGTEGEDGSTPLSRFRGPS